MRPNAERASRSEINILLNNFVKSMTEPNKTFKPHVASECMSKVIANFDLFAHSEVRLNMVNMMRKDIYNQYAQNKTKNQIVADFAEGSLSSIFRSLFCIADAGLVLYCILILVFVCLLILFVIFINRRFWGVGF